MEINIPIEELQKRSIMVATPMYGGQCAGMFTKSCNDLSALAMHYKIPLKFYYLFNESLITRARNYCCDEFLRSDCTHLMFIDSDISFNPNDIITKCFIKYPTGVPFPITKTKFELALKTGKNENITNSDIIHHRTRSPFINLYFIVRLIDFSQHF